MGHKTPISSEYLSRARDAYYLRTQLIKRIERRGLNGVKVYVVSNICYLEK